MEVQDRLIFKLHDDSPEKIAEALGGWPERKHMPRLRQHVVEVPEGPEQEALRAALEANPNVAFVADDQILPLEASPQEAQTLYGLPNVWALTQGDPNVKLMMADTGISATLDLQESQIDRDLGWNFVDNNNDTEDIGQDDHGTNVAIVAVANGHSGDHTGIAPGAKVIPAMVAVPGGISGSAVIDALDYAITNGIQVFSVSYGHDTFNQAGQDAYLEAWNAGIFITASAGNDATETGPHYPSDYDGVMSCTTVLTDGTWAGDQRGDIAAYRPYDRTDEAGTGVIELLGTSFSSPQVAGAAVLLLSRFPNLTNAQIRAALTQSVAPYTDNLDSPDPDSGLWGYEQVIYGILDIEAAMERAATVVAGDAVTWEARYTNDETLAEGDAVGAYALIDRVNLSSFALTDGETDLLELTPGAGEAAADLVFRRRTRMHLQDGRQVRFIVGYPSSTTGSVTVYDPVTDTTATGNLGSDQGADTIWFSSIHQVDSESTETYQVYGTYRGAYSDGAVSPIAGQTVEGDIWIYFDHNNYDTGGRTISSVDLINHDTGAILWSEVAAPYGDPMSSLSLDDGIYRTRVEVTYSDATVDVLTVAAFTVENPPPPTGGDLGNGFDRAGFLDPDVMWGYGANAGDGAMETPHVEVGSASTFVSAAEAGNAYITFTSGLTDVWSIGTVNIGSNVVVDGRGANITLDCGSSGGLELSGSHHVCLGFFTLDGPSDSSADAIRAQGSDSHDLFIRNITIPDGNGDGALDLTQGATDITVAWNRIDWDKGLLWGAHSAETGDLATSMRITAHHNHFQIVFRCPRSRSCEMVHLVNNYHNGWGSGNNYASSSSHGCKMLIEGSVYDPKGGTADRAYRGHAFSSSETEGDMRVEGLLLLDGASGDENNRSSVPDPPYSYTVETADQDLISAITAGAGNIQ